MSKKVIIAIIVIILVIAAAAIVNYYPEKVVDEVAETNISDLSSDRLDDAFQDLEQIDFSVPS